MRKQFILEEEKKNCGAVKRIFDKVFVESGMEDCCILDAENFGFVVLKWYNEKNGFDTVRTFTKGNELFMHLFEEYETFLLYQYAKEERLTELDFHEISEKISEDHKKQFENAKSEVLRQYHNIKAS